MKKSSCMGKALVCLFAAKALLPFVFLYSAVNIHASASQDTSLAPEKQSIPIPSEDFESRLREWKRKAEQGDVEAMHQVYLRYAIAGFQSEAFEWGKRYLSALTEQAQKGDVRSILKLAELYLTGNDIVPRNKETAVYWFGKAADAGNPSGAYVAARLLEEDKEHPNPEQVSEYDRKAFSLYKTKLEEDGTKAADAAYWLGYMYLKGQSVSPDANEALRLLKQADESDLATATNLLAVIFTQGSEGITADPHLAFYYNKRLADNHNSPKGCYLTAISYLRGQGVTADPTLAEEYMQKAAKGHFPQALLYLASEHMRKQEYKEAYILYLQAASLGQADALTQIGKMLIAGQGIEKNEDKGAECLEQAANQFGDAIASFELARLRESQGKQDQADSWYFFASERGHPSAMARRGLLHLLPSSGYVWNPVRSYLWWRLGRDRGDETCARYFNILLWGGVPLTVLVLFGIPSFIVARIQKKRLKEEAARHEQNELDR